MRFQIAFVLSLLSISQTFASTNPPVWYVNSFMPPGGNGQSWLSAFNSLDDALASAHPGDQIWLAQGVYYPSVQTDPADPRSATFFFSGGITLYGGFLGYEPSLLQRAGLFAQTILDGDIGISQNPSDNAYHVVTVAQDNQIDGIMIRNGSGAAGGGILGIPYSIPNTVPDVNVNPTLRLSKINLQHNFASMSGGAIYMSGGALFISETRFVSNTADNGGAITKGPGEFYVTNSTFVHNVAWNAGGAVNLSSGSHGKFMNVLFNENTADFGGAVNLLGFVSVHPNYTAYSIGNGTWSNCTFTRNQARVRGGAVYAHDTGHPTYYPHGLFYNSIIFGNLAQWDPEITVPHLEAYDSILPNIPGSTLVNSGYNDPLFTNPRISDFTLGPGSPAIDAGSNQHVFEDILDLDHNGITAEPVSLDLGKSSRIQGLRIDLGVFEH